MNSSKIKIDNNHFILSNEIEFTSTCSGGPGGQHVNKVSTAIILRFDIMKSSLPESIKKKLLSLKDNRINQNGEIVIRAQQYKSQIKNKEDAIQRLTDFINSSLIVRKKRKPTKPSFASKVKRLEKKSKKSQLKKLRKRVKDWE